MLGRIIVPLLALLAPVGLAGATVGTVETYHYDPQNDPGRWCVGVTPEGERTIFQCAHYGPVGDDLPDSGPIVIVLEGRSMENDPERYCVYLLDGAYELYQCADLGPVGPLVPDIP